MAPFVAAIAFVAGVLAPNTRGAVVEPDNRAQVAGRWKSPDEVYTKICSHCHETSVGPALMGRKLASAVTIAAVRNGPGAMPAFRPTDVDDAMLDRVAEMIENSKTTGKGSSEAKK
jgi:mono/diheme cytochrome c family protein